jgi:capsid protein
VAVGSKDIRHNTRAVFYGYRWLGTGEDERRKFVGKLDDVEARWRDWASKPLPETTVAETRRQDDAATAAPKAAPRPQEASQEPGDATMGSCMPEEASSQPTPPDGASEVVSVVVPTASVTSISAGVVAERTKRPFLYSVTYQSPDGGSTNVVAFTDEQTALSSAIEYGHVLEAIGVGGDFSVDEVPIGWD